MTLAPSHQQQSSGNNIFLVLISLILLITSCSAGKKMSDSKKQTEVVELNTKRDSVAKHTVPLDILDIDEVKSNTKESIIESDVKTDTVVLPVTAIQNQAKNMYKIAVVLPFLLNQIPLNGLYVDDSSKTLLPDSKKAMDFYLGCKIAKEEIQNYAKNINVYFIDDKNNSEELNNLVNSSVLKNADYIIAPFNVNQVKILADFAKSNQKMIFSPTVNSIYAVKNNPFFYSVTPSLFAQYQYLIQNIQQKHPQKKIEIIYNEADTMSEKIVYLKHILNQNSKYPNAEIKYEIHNFNATDNIASKLSIQDTLSDRIVLICSSNEAYIKNVINKLAPIKNKLQIYANSTIRFSKSIITAKNFKHQLFTTYAYNTNSATKIFSQKYEEKYVKNPTEISFLGYDMMKFLLQKIEHNEIISEQNTNSYDEFIQSNFNFILNLNSLGTIDYYDNMGLNLYQMTNGVFVKL
jgi:uncharacterized protein YutD